MTPEKWTKTMKTLSLLCRVFDYITCSFDIGPDDNGVSFDMSFGNAGDTHPVHRKCIVNIRLIFSKPKHGYRLAFKRIRVNHSRN